MSTKPTAGPWRLRVLTNDTLAVYGQGEYEIVFPLKGAMIDANAELIVNAPETLQQRDALLEVVKDIEWSGTQSICNGAAFAGCCPDCRQVNPDDANAYRFENKEAGHETNCALAAALSKAEVK